MKHQLRFKEGLGYLDNVYYYIRGENCLEIGGFIPKSAAEEFTILMSKHFENLEVIK